MPCNAKGEWKKGFARGDYLSDIRERGARVQISVAMSVAVDVTHTTLNDLS